MGGAGGLGETLHKNYDGTKQGGSTKQPHMRHHTQCYKVVQTLKCTLHFRPITMLQIYNMLRCHVYSSPLEVKIASMYELIYIIWRDP